MAHINYLRDIGTPKDKLQNQVKDILTYLTKAQEDKAILLYYYGKHNRLYYLQFYCRSGYITQEHGLYVDDIKAIINKTEPRHHLTESYFFPNCSVNLSKALTRLKKSYFYTLKNEWEDEKNIPDSFQLTTNCDFVMRDNIDTIDTVAFLSSLQTIANTSDEKQKKIHLDKIVRLFEDKDN